ncbi:MAG: hypothetical protein JXR37_04895 [Kiritimatiellae bacterium]|nr:hypothetical protein [Kiritimatiellia bacterium]
MKSTCVSLVAALWCLNAVGSSNRVDHLPVWKGGVATLGSVQVDAQQRCVTAKGWINQTQGLVELLACGPNGKVHESVLVLDVNPLDLQTALLLLNLKPGRPPAALGEGRPEGPELELWVHWQESSTNRSLRAERLLYDDKGKKDVPETRWVFTGSAVENGKFMALAEESLVATYWDPWAIVNLPLDCGANDDILLVNEKTVPPLKTPVTLEMRVR